MARSESQGGRPRHRLDVNVEPWPAGGWAVWVEGDSAPISRHDTEREAEFRASAYRQALGLGKELAFSDRDEAGDPGIGAGDPGIGGTG